MMLLKGEISVRRTNDSPHGPVVYRYYAWLAVKRTEFDSRQVHLRLKIAPEISEKKILGERES